MRALIVYRSKYGTTAECADRIADSLDAKCTVVDLRRNLPDPASYDIVVIGGSIYAGKIQNAVVRFCEQYRHALQRMRVGYYICCLYTGDRAREELEGNFPDWLKAHATVGDWLGGRAVLNTMKGIDRFLFRKVAGVEGDVSAIREERIDRFCAALNASVGG